MESELRSLLSRWAAVEPKRCRQRNDFSFDVAYLGQWITVTVQAISHGAIIASVLAGCQENEIFCSIDYTPRYDQQPASVEVGCVFRAFRYAEGEEVISSIPGLLLKEYLEQLETSLSRVPT
ncbi:MAG: hypothetical protein AABN33_24180 [Acidobacteriota bacterium]